MTRSAFSSPPKLRDSLFVTLTAFFVALAGCSGAPEDARIPSDVTKRSPAFVKAMDALMDDDEALLNRYLLRQKLSAAYDSGALPKAKRIKDALAEQRAYEKHHPHDPTGKIAYLKAINGATDQSKNLLFVELLRVAQVADGDSNFVQLQLVLSNGFDKPVSGVKGTARLTSVKDPKQFVDIVLDEVFSSPIPVEGSIKVKERSSIAPIAVMKAIKDKSLVSAQLSMAEVTFADGSQMAW